MPKSERQSPVTLANLLPALGEKLRLRGSPETRIRGLTYDSRHVEAGYLFSALPGLHTDGHRFIDQAIRRGAAAVLHQDELGTYRDGVAYLQVPDSRQGMSALSAAFYEYPSRELPVVPVSTMPSSPSKKVQSAKFHVQSSSEGSRTFRLLTNRTLTETY